MKRLKQSILWGMIHGTAGRLLQFMGTLVLARLLVPEAFGLFAVAQGVTMLLGLVISAGWLQTLVRREEEDPETYNTVFTFQFVLCLVAWAGLWAGASLLSRWLGDDRLGTILPILGLTLFSRPVFVFHAVFLHRGMHFKKLAKINMTVAAATLLLTVMLALLGAGVWSLVVGRIANASLLGLLVGRATGQRPGIGFDFSRFRAVFHEAYRFALLKGVDHLMGWGPYALVSRLHGAGDVGYLQRGISTAQIPVEVAGQAVNAPMFRAYAATETESQREYYLLRALSAWVFYMWPIAWILHVYPDIVINVMYGPQWSASVPLLEIYAWYLFFFPLQSVSRSYITSCQGPGRILKLRTAMLGILAASLLAWNDDLREIAVVMVAMASLEALLAFGLALAEMRVSMVRVLSVAVTPALGVLLMIGIRHSGPFSMFAPYDTIMEMGLVAFVYGMVMLLFPGGNLEAGRWRERVLQVAGG